jgi:hypothetical protein
MKYIEEISFGDIFELNKEIFILTKDFDNKRRSLCVSLNSGQLRWLPSNTIVETVNLYRLDNENNIYNIKPENNKTT